MQKIPLTKGKFALVDDADFEWLSQWRWCCHGAYAVRNSPRPNRHTIFMHRLINNTPDGMETDHVNGNPLDNRRENLRSCTRTENVHNTRMNHDNKSGFKGVYWNKRAKKWYAQIANNGKHHHLGTFNTAQEAAVAYNAVAHELHGEFAKPNFGVK